MAMHAIILAKPDIAVKQRIAEKYSEHYDINDTCIIVHTKDLSAKVAEKIDLKSYANAEKAAGIVVRLSGARSGLASPDFWEWFAEQDTQDLQDVMVR